MRNLASLLTILLALSAGASGVFTLRSQAGVEVIWEGVVLGKTDAAGLMVIEEIPAGDYRLTLRKAGFHPLDVQITVEDGESASRRMLLTPVDDGGARAKPGESADQERRLDGGVRLGPGGGEAESAALEIGAPGDGAERADEAAGGRSGAGAGQDPPAGAQPDAGGAAGATPLAPQPAAPQPAAPQPAAPQPAAPQPAAPQPAGAEPKASFPFYLGAAVLLFALLVWIFGSRFLGSLRKTGLAETPPPGVRRPQGGVVEDEVPFFEPDAEPGSPEFLEDLKRRERHLGDRPRPARPRRSETIIEVEAVEVRPVDET